MLQCVAVQYTSVNCSLQDDFPLNAWTHRVADTIVAARYSVLQCCVIDFFASGFIELQSQLLQCVAVCCSVLSLTSFHPTHGCMELQSQLLQCVAVLFYCVMGYHPFPYGVNYMSLLQKSPIKQTIFYKRDEEF